MKKWLYNNGKVIWYTLLFAFLGLIDQRRGSAVGEVQMLFSNCIGLIVILMLLPSLPFEKIRQHNFKINKDKIIGRLKRPFFWCFVILMLLMQFSRHEGYMPLYYLVVFGAMYLVGIPEENRKSFFTGMLNGMILWFFVQQIVAFGFRPYDYIRYRGLYSGETQNGLFYMFAYCAFLLKWVLARKEGSRPWVRFLWFFLSSGCISFMLFTGGRSPLVGAAVVTVLVYVWYDILQRKSLYRCLLHCCALGICIIITFPCVYGCIRYLPTILHHPIWFEGEYSADTSVHSYDPWNSERYISFEEAASNSVGRVLQTFGINLKDFKIGSIGALRVEAAELGEPGSTPDNPYALPGIDFKSSVSIRQTIYDYYIKHLNWFGHSQEQPGFYIKQTSFIDHAHNMFLQIGYEHGILAGILFLGMYIYALIDTMQKRRWESIICFTFLVAILCFGMFEMAVVHGQITMSFIWIIFSTMAGGNKQHTAPQKGWKSIIKGENN